MKKFAGIDEDGDGEPYDFFAIYVRIDDIFPKQYFDQVTARDMIEDQMDFLTNHLNYYKGFDFNTDRGCYMGNCSKNEIEIRFYRSIESIDHEGEDIDLSENF